MTLQRTVGILLVSLGLIALIVGGISWTRTKTVLDIGPLQATTQEHHTLPLSPLLGVIGLIGGVTLLAMPSTGRA